MNKDLDILHRDRYILILKQIIDSVVKSSKSAVFAIDGKWGIGKTFIVDKLNKEIDKSKYIVFNYNCWQYDYYEEPLVAIISNIQDNIQYCSEYYEEEFLKEQRANKGMAAVYSVGNSVFKKFTGVDLQKIGENALNINKEYDKNNSFRKIIADLQGMLKSITKTIPIIFIVDELDRCMPEYTIKVLERIHHIFYGFENVIVIFSVDRTQLDYSVKKIFGESTDIDGYLKKFVDFTIRIDSGTISEDWEEKYLDSFFQSFNLQYMEDLKQEIRQYLSLLNIREVENVLSKITIINNILKNDDKYILDDVICCYEIVNILVKEHFRFMNNLDWLTSLMLHDKCVEINNQNIKNFDKNHDGKFSLQIRKFVKLITEKKQESILNNGYGIYLKNDGLCIWYGLFYLTYTDSEPYRLVANPNYSILPHEKFKKYIETISYINELMHYI